MRSNIIHGSTFLRNLRKALVYTIPQFLLMALVFPFWTYDSISSNLRQIKEGFGSTDRLIYCMVDFNNAEIFPLIAVTLGALFGFLMFYFFDSKKAMNVYYSAGMKRKTLFNSVYLAGAVASALSIGLPLIANAVINTVMLGGKRIITTTTVYYFLILFLMNMLGYTVSSLCTAGTGTLPEGIIDTLGIISIPFLAPKLLAYLSRRALNGSAAGMPTILMLLEKPYSYTEYIPKGYVHLIPERINPFAVAETAFSSKYVDRFENVKITPSSVWDVEGAVFTVIFLIAAVALLGLLANFVFAKRKAEFCGIPGAQRWLNVIGASILSFYIFCFVFTAVPIKSAVVSAVIALIIFIAVFFLLFILTEHSFSKGIKNYKQCLIPTGAVIALIIVLSAGMFGYTSYVPEADEIKSARVSCVMTTYDSTRLNDYGTRATSEFSNHARASYRSAAAVNPDKFTYCDSEDIPELVALHKHLTKSKGYKLYRFPYEPIASRDIAISYTLKNGKTVIRYFRNCDDEAFDKLCMLQQNKLHKEELIANFRELLIENPESYIAFTSRFNDKYIMPEMSVEEKAELFSALEKDIMKRTAEERFFPKTSSLGYIGVANVSVMTDDDGNEIKREIFDQIIPEMLLTPDMTNTISVLEKLGVIEKMKLIPDIKEIMVFDDKNIKCREDYSPIVTNSYDMVFVGNKYKEMVNKEAADKSKVLIIKDKAQINALAEIAEPYYPTTRGGYVVLMTMDSFDSTDILEGTNPMVYTMFIPKDRAPEFLKAAEME